MILHSPKRRSSRNAFTLVEMLVVVAIIVVLAGIAVPTYLNVLDSSKRDLAKSQCKTLANAVLIYKNDQENNPEGALPTSWDEMLSNSRYGLNPDAIKDPWAHPYHLTVPSSHNNASGFDVWSDCNGSSEPVGNW